MRVSTKGRYALRVMADLAEHGSGSYIPLKEICERQDISKKYLESIVGILSKAGLVEGASGKGGGYRLTKRPEEYHLDEILTLTEGSLAPVACTRKDAEPCRHADSCCTLPVWVGLSEVIQAYLNKITLKDLVQNGNEHSHKEAES